MIRHLRTLFVAALAALAPASLILAPIAEAAVTYSAAAKTARMTAVRDALNNGTLVMLHSDGTTVLATFTLSATSGTVSGSTLTFSFVATTVTAAASGTCTTAKFRTSAPADYITGLTCGAGSGDVNLNTTTIGSGANVTLTSAAITHAFMWEALPRYANDNLASLRLRAG